MSRYVQKLIDQIRRETENESVAEGIGIQDEEFIQYINDAQFHLQGMITSKHSKIFLSEELYSISSGSTAFILPDNIYLDNKIHHVEFSSTGNDDDYYTLNEVSFKRRSQAEGSPNGYVRYSGKIELTPKTSTNGYLRIIYTERLPNVELRRGFIHLTTQVGTNLTKLTSLVSDKYYDLQLFENNDYISIVDSNGNLKAKKVKIESYNTTNGDIVVDHTLEAGVTISQGDYIVGGPFSTSHSQLPESVERYLIAYCSWKILRRDSSVDSTEMMQELQVMGQEIVASYALMSDDLQYIPLLTDWVDWSTE